MLISRTSPIPTMRLPAKREITIMKTFGFRMVGSGLSNVQRSKAQEGQ